MYISLSLSPPPRMYPFIIIIIIIINAVNQHSPSLDLDLLRHVVAAVPEGIVLVLDPAAAQGEECHERSPLMRVWCIWEILCALRAKPNPRPVLVKMGRTVPTTAAADDDSGVGGEKKIGRAGAGAVGVAGAAEGAAEGGAPKRDTQQPPPPPPPPFRFQVEWDRDTVALIVKSLSLKDARAKHEPDRLSILADIRHTYPGGAAAMERCVVSALWASYSGRNLAALQFAVQGLGALKQALASGMADLDARNPERWTALHCAASAGLTFCSVQPDCHGGKRERRKRCSNFVISVVFIIIFVVDVFVAFVAIFCIFLARGH